MHEVTPWKMGKDVPPELRRALKVLGTQDTHPARFDRVAARLVALLDAPPPPPPPAVAETLLRHAHRKLAATRLALAVVAVGTTALWLARPAPHDTSSHSPPAVHSQRSSNEAPAATPLPAPVSQDAAPSDVSATMGPTERSARSQPGPAKPRLTRPARSRRVRSAARSTQAVTSATGTTSGSASAQPGSQTAPAEQPSPAAAKPAAQEPAAPEPESNAQREQSEIQLLFDARLKAKSDPSAALRLLDEHAARFATGLLTPEREVLAIEVLRKLGRTGEAERRLLAFRERYPASLHLRRLDRAK
jgi:hypothetical protein